jgi:hypothetical protein
LIINVFDYEEIEETTIKFAFSQSRKLVALYSAAGYSVFLSESLLKQAEAEPLITKTKETLKFGILHFAFLYDTKIFAMVPNKKRGPFSSSRVLLWDDVDKETIAEYNFHNKIDHLIYLKDSLIVNCGSKIIFFNTEKGQVIK